MEEFINDLPLLLIALIVGVGILGGWIELLSAVAGWL